MYHVISFCTLYVNKCMEFMYLICSGWSLCTVYVVHGVYVTCM